MSNRDNWEAGWWTYLFDPFAILFGVLFAASYIVLLIVKLPVAVLHHVKGTKPKTNWQISAVAGGVAATLTVAVFLISWAAMFITYPATRIGTLLIFGTGAVWYYVNFYKRSSKR